MIQQNKKSKKYNSKPIKRNEKEDEDGSILSMFTSCNSRKKEVKIENDIEKIKKEDDSSCLIY